MITQVDHTRTLMANGIGGGDLIWYTVPLVKGCTIEVCYPVRMTLALTAPGPLSGSFFVPISPVETWKIAKANDAYPLTRAVMDQAHNLAIKNGGAVEFVQQQLADLLEYPKYNKKLMATAYGTNYPTSKPSTPFPASQVPSIVSGAHKLWVLSKHPGNYQNPNTVNYGGYTKTTTSRAAGKYLNGSWHVQQHLEGGHHTKWWDYSQLLQLMRNLKGAVHDGTTVAMSLREALLIGHEAVWDEDTNLDQDDLKSLP
jgi:hypothetical protein